MTNSKPSMLIVDDESTTRTLLTHVFGQLGYSVRTAEDGFDALDQIRDQAPDILLSDLNMPHMSGFELLSVIRRRIPNIYVIASSGAFSGNSVPNGIAADAFHEKGTGMENLLNLVQTARASAPVPRPGSSASLPVWISPVKRNAALGADVLISCPECLRSFSIAVGVADFVIHQTSCLYCSTDIHYATVQPMDPALPHRFHAHGETLPVLDCSAAS